MFNLQKYDRNVVGVFHENIFFRKTAIILLFFGFQKQELLVLPAAINFLSEMKTYT